jgi:hypothetical protein
MTGVLQFAGNYGAGLKKALAAAKKDGTTDVIGAPGRRPPTWKRLSAANIFVSSDYFVCK